MPFEEGLRRTIAWYRQQNRTAMTRAWSRNTPCTEFKLQAALTATPEEVIYPAPVHGWSALNLNDLWVYRELVYFLTWRDIKVRYKQTVLGAAWAIIQPFMTMVVFTIFFGELAKLSIGRRALPDLHLHRAAALGVVHQGADRCRALAGGQPQHDHQDLFPRLVIPIASVLGGVVDFAIAFWSC